MDRRVQELQESIASSVDYLVEAAKINVGIDLLRLFEYSGLSQIEWAQKIGKSEPYVSKLLRHDVNFTIETLVKLAHSLNGRVNIGLSSQDETPSIRSRAIAVPYASVAPQVYSVPPSQNINVHIVANDANFALAC